MLTTHLQLFTLLLYSVVAPIIAGEQWGDVFDLGDDLFCHNFLPIRKDITRFTSECLTAIDMIPKGLTLDADNWKATKLPPDGRPRLSLDKRTNILPAGFRWGNYLVTVVPESQVPRRAHVVDGHSDAGAMLQFKVWPHARKAASEIFKRCLQARKEGGYMTEIISIMRPFSGVLWLNTGRRRAEFSSRVHRPTSISLVPTVPFHKSSNLFHKSQKLLIDLSPPDH